VALGCAVSRFGDVGGLRTFGTLSDLKFDFVPLLQALISFSRDRAVVNEDVRSTLATDETVSFCVVEPLDRTFQTFHVRPPRHVVSRRARASRLLPLSGYQRGLSREAVTTMLIIYG
jgi:hypothetical protein